MTLELGCLPKGIQRYPKTFSNPPAPLISLKFDKNATVTSQLLQPQQNSRWTHAIELTWKSWAIGVKQEQLEYSQRINVWCIYPNMFSIQSAQTGPKTRYNKSTLFVNWHCKDYISTNIQSQFLRLPMLPYGPDKLCFSQKHGCPSYPTKKDYLDWCRRTSDIIRWFRNNIVLHGQLLVEANQTCSCLAKQPWQPLPDK